jgi:rhamnose utilization protein RhaD (predicted bifunctional aldolase and dehydrogenase)
MSDDILRQLIALSNDLGRPELDYVILGEGNTSARADADSFYVKVSGAELRTATTRGFVRVKFAPVMALLDMPGLDDKRTKAALTAAKVDPDDPGHPSIETLLHAICLGLPGVDWVGHTHPMVVNALTCSVSFEEAFGGRVFPDEIVLCGPASVLVPYTDPGVPLARAVAAGIQTFIRDYGEQPRVIVLQNHGLIALGRTAGQVEEITRMAVKAARIRLGTFSAGGPRFLSPRDVDRIHTRPDEEFRRKQLGLDLRGTDV